MELASKESDTCDVTGQAVYVYIEEQVRVAGAHVEKQVEERREHGHAEVDDGEERHHLHCAPERLDQLAAQADGHYVRAHLPEVYLQEAEGERRPEPEGRRQQVTWRHAQDAHRLLGEGQAVREQHYHAYELDAGAGVAQEGSRLLPQVGNIPTQALYRRHPIPPN